MLDIFRYMAKYSLVRDLMNIPRALADDNRVRTLLALRRGELCVCQITELFGVAVSTMSKHLSILYQAGLVDSRKEGRWIYYSLPAKPSSAVSGALSWLFSTFGNTDETVQDQERLAEIVKLDPVDVCKRQCKKSKSCSSVPVIPAEARWPKAGHAISKETASKCGRRALKSMA